uniref:Cleavage/polyadenylation specificity factor A subunit C-terminal domain-containing protein n=1 Tax=Ditylenchus dipsaci TaxID=166011 RepID=A0A915DI23_9BILA
MYFFLVQSEQGDVFKVTLEADNDIVTEMRIKYFDTLPTANSLCILKTGFLFVASEFGNHQLYQILHLGESDDEPEFSSRMPLEEGETFFYDTRALQNLVLIDQIDSLSPLVSARVADLANEDAPQIYALCGRGPRSSLRVLRNGLEVSEMAVSELPGNPNAVWTVKKNVDDQFHAHIVVSFVNATLVLSIGETVEEVTDSGFLGTTPTIGCGLIGTTLFSRCIPMLDVSNQLREYSERREMTADVLCMSMSEVPEGELLRIISLDTTDTLAPLSMQALPAEPESLMVMETAGEETGSASIIHLNIGLVNGCLLRVTLDQVTGDLSDNRTRYLGTKPVKLFRVKIQNKEALFACSSRAWLFYSYQSRFHLTPLSYTALEYASSFSSEQCNEGIVAIAENTLRILALEKLGTVFNQIIYPLKYTPRRFVVHPQSQNLIIIETDHASFTEKAKRRRRDELAEEIIELANDPEEKTLATEMADSKSTEWKWASAVRMINAKAGQTLCHYELPEGEAAFSVELVQFRSQHDSVFVLVGCAVELEMKPYKAKGGCIYTFLLTNGGNRFEFIHRTAVDGVVNAIHDFRGVALVGVGKRIRMYDFGKKKLLAKCENRVGF